MSKPDDVVIILAHVLHSAVTHGFLPSALRSQKSVLIVTDHAEDYRNALASTHPQVRVIDCDVFNPLSVIGCLLDQQVRPDAILSNSDHLQSSAAIIAKWFGLPAKDWRLCVAAKNKAQTRARARALGLPTPWSAILPSDAPIPTNIPFPIVAKPVEGVASLDVSLCRTAEELRIFRDRVASHVIRPLLLEAYLEGDLFTVETLGDGRDLQLIGGFDVALSPPPHFIECSARWNGPVGRQFQKDALAQLKTFGIGLGVCHSEFIATSRGPVLVEINYRSIGDGREFVLDRLSDGAWFRAILALHCGNTLRSLPRIDLSDAAAEIHYLVATTQGIIQHAPNPFEESGISSWAQYRPLRQTGDSMTITHSNKDYVGVLSLAAADKATLDALREQYLPRQRVLEILESTT